MSAAKGNGLGLTYGWVDGESGWGDSMNENLEILDQSTPISVVAETSTPPATPADGSRYLVGDSPTGAWVGRAGSIATYTDDAWVFYTPVAGRTHAVVTSTGRRASYGPSGWQYEGQRPGSTLATGVVGVMGAAPTSADIPDGEFAVIQNTADESVKLYANIGGVIVSVALS